MLKQKIQLKKLIKHTECKIEEDRAEKKLDDIEEYLNHTVGAKNAETVRGYVKDMETIDGNFCQQGLWRIKQKLCPRSVDPPMAKMNNQGQLITSSDGIKNLYLDTYVERLSHREMKSEYLDIYCLKTELWISRMKNLEMKISPLWQMNDLDKALKSLKNNKTMDPHGIINEVFKEGCVGRDLKEALLLLFNGMKSNLFIPKFMTFENISTIYKNKGSRLQLDNDRGIFILTVLKKILDKLTYHDKYDDIDIHMSDSNIGARKKKNIKQAGLR